MKRGFAVGIAWAIGCGGAQTQAPPPHEIPVVRQQTPQPSESPETWIARLDDEGRRAEAIDWLTKAYVRGHTDDATRVAIIKALAHVHDARTLPALSKALGSYEPGKTDEDVKYAADGVDALAKAGTHFDARLVDGLWNAFEKYRPSRTNSIQGTQAIHDAILAVKDPTYGEKAVEMLTAADEPENNANGTRKVNDQLELWQTTAIQVVKTLHYTRAARALVSLLVMRSKMGIQALTKSALMRMPAEAEPLLVAVLTGSDPDLAKLRDDWTDKAYVPIVLDVLSYLSIDAARDAVLAFVPKLDNDANRVAAAQSLIWYAPHASVVPTFKRLYERLPPIATKGAADDTGMERAQLLGVVGELFDPALASWAIAQSTNATGAASLSAKVGAIQSALKLMRPADKPLVARAVASIGAGLSPQEKRAVDDNVRLAFENASAALDKCAVNASCYVQLLDDPIASTPSGNWKAIKSAYMAGWLGSDQTRRDLVAHIPKVKNAGARTAIAIAVNHLAPKGDVADADALDKIVEDDTARRDSDALRGDDALTKVALMLRARAAK
jgi:hypothetical protein